MIKFKDGKIIDLPAPSTERICLIQSGYFSGKTIFMFVDWR